MCRGPSESTGKSVSLRPTVVLVDPYSTGAMLAPELEQRGMVLVSPLGFHVKL